MLETQPDHVETEFLKQNSSENISSITDVPAVCWHCGENELFESPQNIKKDKEQVHLPGNICSTFLTSISPVAPSCEMLNLSRSSPCTVSEVTI